MNDDTQLGNWMRSLPRAKASPGFTSEVMRRARGAESRRPLAWRMAAAFAMAACLAVAVHITVVEQAQRRKFAALRVEQQKLQQELQAVKQSAQDAGPVVVLENDRGTRVIMDLDGDLDRDLDRDIDSAIQPASLRTYD